VSRIGKLPIPVPAGVKVSREGDKIVVEGPKGKNEEKIHPNMVVEIGESEILVKRPDDEKFNRSLHGLTRSLISNAVLGVTEGFTKKLLIEGVGYRAQMSGKNLSLELGFSHKIDVPPPANVSFETPSQTEIIVSGIDKQVVGEISAKIRSFRPPEPYKGKGVRYENERIIRKAGKAGTAAGA
jgi:large subunit ribosomal protein L6